MRLKVYTEEQPEGEEGLGTAYTLVDRLRVVQFAYAGEGAIARFNYYEDESLGPAGKERGGSFPVVGGAVVLSDQGEVIDVFTPDPERLSSGGAPTIN